MKIGVAISGCDIGGVGAYGVLKELADQGLEIAMISVSGLPAITALPFACGLAKEPVCALVESFLGNLKETDMDTAVAELAERLPMKKLHREEEKNGGRTIPFALNAVNIPDGKILTFTNLYTIATDRLETWPLDDVYDVLSATVSPADGLVSYRYRGYRLCDFSIWYGSPVYPLNMAGVEKTISVAFVPGSPETPYEALVKHRLAASAGLSDIHIPIEMERMWQEPEGYMEIAAGKVRSCIDDICVKMAFL